MKYNKSPPVEDSNLNKYGKLFLVYCHTNIINGKKYIGITCQKPNQRFRNGKGYKSSPHFNSAIQKYGWDNFTHEILYENLSKDEAELKEIELIKQYNTRNENFGYNITPGGECCCGEDNPWYGHHHTKEARKKMSEKRKGKRKTEEWKRKISESNKNKVVSEETKKKMRQNHADISGAKNPNFGKKLSKEQIQKMVRASKTDEAIAKMKKHKVWYSGKDNPNSKMVICIETGIIFDTVKEAAEKNGCNPSKISAVCHGHRKQTNHLHFKFVEE